MSHHNTFSNKNKKVFSTKLANGGINIQPKTQNTHKILKITSKK
jgi:hypothetical protein